MSARPWLVRERPPREQPGPSAALPRSRHVWLVSPLRRIEWLLDDSPASRSRGGTRIRVLIGGLFLVYGAVIEAGALAKKDFQFTPLWIVLGALPIVLGRLGRLGRYFIPVILGLLAYSYTADYVVRFKLRVHYTPQIRIDELLGGGTLPTVWLQEHLYHGRTGALEVFCVAAYAGHLLVPLGLGVLLALMNRAHEFKLLMFGILTALLMGVVVFILAPTAPPWLAAQDGYLSGVHHVLRTSLVDLDLKSLAELDGDQAKYDVTAAVPSLHAAFPLICLLVALRARLPRAVVAFLVLDVVGVLFAIVYMGEHYVVDALAGFAGAVVAVRVVRSAAGAESELSRLVDRRPGPASSRARAVEPNGE